MLKFNFKQTNIFTKVNFDLKILISYFEQEINVKNEFKL